MDDVNRLTTENLRMARAIIFLKREVILHRTGRENRDFIVNRLNDKFDRLNNDFQKLLRNYDNIKEMQNHISYENSLLTQKINYLEDIILTQNEKSKNGDEC